jgi:putative transposase
MNRASKRSPRLTGADRTLFVILAHIIPFGRLRKLAIVVKPTTILNFHKALVKRKYSRLYSNRAKKKPGRKVVSIDRYKWKTHCNGLYELPVAA